VVDVVGFAQGRFDYSAAWVAGVDKIAVAGVDADVGDAAAVGVLEEDQVAGGQVGFVYGFAVVELVACGAWQLYSAGAENVADEAGTVEARARCAAEAVSDAAQGERRGDYSGLLGFGGCRFLNVGSVVGCGGSVSKAGKKGYDG